MSATMRSSWADSTENSAIGSSNTNGSSRPVRPAYVPPHLRNRSLSSEPSVVATERENHGGGMAPWGCSANSKPDAAGRQGNGSAGGGGGWNNRGAVWEHGGRHEVNPFENDDALDQSFDEQENTGINFDAYDDIPAETSGDNVPLPANTFAEIDLGEALNQNILRWKYVKPTPVQRYAIPISLAGRDLMACAQTVYGKTDAFCFPIISGIMREHHIQRSRVARTAFPLALIVSPTRELLCQIHDEARKFSYQSVVKVVVAYG